VVAPLLSRAPARWPDVAVVRHPRVSLRPFRAKTGEAMPQRVVVGPRTPSGALRTIGAVHRASRNEAGAADRLGRVGDQHRRRIWRLSAENVSLTFRQLFSSNFRRPVSGFRCWSQVASVKRRSIEFAEEDRHLAANDRLGFAVTTLMVLVMAILLVRWFSGRASQPREWCANLKAARERRPPELSRT
jgi:hypothetical protein